MRAAHLALAAAGLLGLLLSPPTQALLTARMSLHMNVQLPLLLLCGVGLLQPWRDELSAWLAPVNRFGVTGLLLVSGLVGVWMVPRALDAAVAQAGIDALKIGALLLAGALLALSWRPAGPVIQGFFVGNTVWMSATVGVLIAESPLRLCNAYLDDDQRQAGYGLLMLAVLLGIGWMFSLRPSSQPSAGPVACQTRQEHA